MIALRRALFLISAFVCLVVACRKSDSFTTDSAAKLAFSSDTLRFDTVFTSIGSATRSFKIFNRNSQAVKISKISLANKTKAVFNLNIDGISGRSFTDVEIPANDSIYVFAEVTINPNDPLSVSPFVIAEDLNFETNGNAQRVVLEAFGQNANYIPSRFAAGKQATLDCGGGEVVWNDPKPYVIYGVLGVANGTLRLPAGTRVHVHGGLARPNDSTLYRDGILYFFNNAKLVTEGTIDKPVIIEGDRLEKEFGNEPDQWGGIILADGSRNNALNFTTIRNARVAIRVDSAASLTMKNCKIYNTASSGLLAQRATMSAENCLFYENGGNSVQLEYGGNYDLKYCTLTSYGQERALSANNLRCVERDAIGNCTRALVFPLSMALTNCVIYGSREDQINLFDATTTVTTDFNFTFKNCVVRVKDLLTAKEGYPNFLTANCTDCINAPTTAKLFRKPSSGDFHLDTLSIAEQKAFPIPAISTDLDRKARDLQKPDIGCFEFYPR
jgi:Right handed beta helix region